MTDGYSSSTLNGKHEDVGANCKCALCSEVDQIAMALANKGIAVVLTGGNRMDEMYTYLYDKISKKTGKIPSVNTFFDLSVWYLDIISVPLESLEKFLSKYLKSFHSGVNLEEILSQVENEQIEGVPQFDFPMVQRSENVPIILPEVQMEEDEMIVGNVDPRQFYWPF